ncbi:MAG: GNAT family N-acetyltransferase [Aestuariivita sp.]|uniref:GNAT family N-acetyltransferase n=1 Tax=Aestuariivita sp. TaxID=1872407 RepID=UPI003BB0518D
MTRAPDIRPLAPADRAAFVALVSLYLAEIAPTLAPPATERIARSWSDPDRFAFTLHDGGLVGFALITRLANGTHEMSEFYIAPTHRKAGLGRAMVGAILPRFPGRWQLGLAKGSPGARDFWTRALADYPIKRGPPLTPNQSASLHFTVKETPT